MQYYLLNIEYYLVILKYCVLAIVDNPLNIELLSII